MTPTLETERLTLRRPNASDWPAFWDFFQSERSIGVGGPMDLAKAWRHFGTELGHWEFFGYGMWAVTLRGTDKIIGLIGPWTPPDFPEKEVGWMIFDETVEGSGMATEAAQAAVAHAFAVLKWDTVVSYVGPDNLRSARLAQKLGAVLDPDADIPARYPGTLVFRHPKPRDQ